MLKNYNSKVDLNKFFTDIQLKKIYINKLQNKIILLNNIKEKKYKVLGSQISSTNRIVLNNFVLYYTIDITFSKANTFLHVMDPLGNLMFFCSAGSLKFTGKAKRSRYLVFREMYRILVSKFEKHFKGRPIAVHLKNVGPAKFWVLKRLKKKFFIRTVKIFSLYPYNGCRKRKMRRKKFKK